MLILVMTLCIGLALADTEGYNYQIELMPSGESHIQAVPNQYHLYGQYSSAGEVQQLPQIYSLDQGGLQFGAQLQQKQLQATDTNQAQFAQPSQTVEPPNREISDQLKQSETPLRVFDPHSHFIVKQKVQSQSTPAQEKVSFQKEFYYLSAPQEEYETPKELEDQLSTIKKNLRVVFIKAPENNGIEKAALQLAQQSANAQTAIYVLTKQHDASDLANKLQAIKSSSSQRPEVAFIKYRTPEEAEHAQRVIQAQYEALDGPNHINLPDVGVTHNFVGSTLTSVDPRKSNGISSTTEAKTEKTPKFGPKYLPASPKL